LSPHPADRQNPKEKRLQRNNHQRQMLLKMKLKVPRSAPQWRQLPALFRMALMG
jgi:hypothetical protein